MQRLSSTVPARWRPMLIVAAATVGALLYLTSLHYSDLRVRIALADVGLAVGCCLTLLMRRRRPEVMFGVAVAVTVITNWTDLAVQDIARMLILVSLYFCAVYRPARVYLTAGLVTVALGLAAAQSSGTLLLVVTSLTAMVAAPILLGRHVWATHRIAADARALAAEADRRRLAETQAHRAEERARIARDVHDIVAHHVSSIVVQAGAARFAAAARPQEVLPALERIHTAGDLTLRNLRQLLDVLADPGDSPAPGPSLAGIADLVDHARHRGTPVTVHQDGPTDGTDATVAACAYRVVQEALTNAGKHAGPTTAVDVRLTATDHTLRVQVRNAAPADPAWRNPLPSTGRGLTGMRTRVALLGGTLHAAPDGAGGWLVTADLPHHRGRTDAAPTMQGAQPVGAEPATAPPSPA